MTPRQRYRAKRRAAKSAYIMDGITQLEPPARPQHIDVLWRLYAKGLGGCLSYASRKGKSREWAHALLCALRKRFVGQ